MGRIRLRSLELDPEEIKEGRTQVTISFRAMHEDEETDADLIFKVDPDNRNLFVVNNGTDSKQTDFSITAPHGSFKYFDEEVTLVVKNPPIVFGPVGVQLICVCEGQRDSVLNASVFIIN